MVEKIKCPECKNKLFTLEKNGSKLEITCHKCGKVLVTFTEKNDSSN